MPYLIFFKPHREVQKGTSSFTAVSNFEAQLEISHDCPYCRFTEKHPGSTITAWTNEVMHVAVIESDDPSTLDDYQDGFREYLPFAHVSRQRGRLEIAYGAEHADPSSVIHLIALNGCIWTQPNVTRDGWESYRIFSFSHENIVRLVESIKGMGGEVRIRSIRPVDLPCFCSDMLVPAENILAGLTDKQVEMLCEAFSLGYFDQPAKVTADELARRAGVSRSTFTEHLRKAEGKVMTNLYPVLRLACKRDLTGKKIE